MDLSKLYFPIFELWVFSIANLVIKHLCSWRCSMFQVSWVPLETMTSFEASRTLSRAWCSASDTHVFPGGWIGKMWKHLADLLVKLGGGSRVMKSMEQIIDIITHNTHTHIYIYIRIYIQYVNIGTYMHMYLYIYMQMYSFGMSGFAKKIPILSKWGGTTLKSFTQMAMAATTLRGPRGGWNLQNILGFLEPLRVYLSCFGSRFCCGGYLWKWYFSKYIRIDPNIEKFSCPKSMIIEMAEIQITYDQNCQFFSLPSR